MVAVEGDAARVQVIGRGTMKIGPVLRDFFEDVESRGVRKVMLDFSECETLDSTFLGILAGLSMRLRRESGTVSACGLTLKPMGLFKTLGLDHLIDSAPVCPPSADGMTTLSRADSDRADDETILEAHEALVAADESNASKFRDVIEFMRDSIARRQEGDVHPT